MKREKVNAARRFFHQTGFWGKKCSRWDDDLQMLQKTTTFSILHPEAKLSLDNGEKIRCSQYIIFYLGENVSAQTLFLLRFNLTIDLAVKLQTQTDWKLLNIHPYIHTYAHTYQTHRTSKKSSENFGSSVVVASFVKQFNRLSRTRRELFEKIIRIL